jgi:hypothetical protein
MILMSVEIQKLWLIVVIRGVAVTLTNKVTKMRKKSKVSSPFLLIWHQSARVDDLIQGHMENEYQLNEPSLWFYSAILHTLK